MTSKERLEQKAYARNEIQLNIKRLFEEAKVAREQLDRVFELNEQIAASLQEYFHGDEELDQETALFHGAVEAINGPAH